MLKSPALRIGIVGAGVMAEYHVTGYRKAGAEVVAIADRNPEAGTRFARKMEIPEVYASLTELLARCHVDAVSVITPNKFHRELAIEALEHGCHVFCEKPPALSAAETMEMKLAAERNGKLLSFNFNNRAREESRAVMDYIRSGEMGRINSAQAVWMRRSGIPGFGGWFTSKSLSGGGPLIDLLHMMDLALYFMGYPEPEWVLAQTFDDFISNRNFKGVWGIPDGKNGVTDVENACHAFLRFRSSQVLFVRSSWAEMIEREEIYVSLQGSRAGALIRRRFDRDGVDLTSRDDTRLFTCEHGRQVNRNIILPKDEMMGRIDSIGNFVNAIRGEEPALVTPDEAVSLMRIIDGIYRSAREGAPVRFD